MEQAQNQYPLLAHLQVQLQGVLFLQPHTLYPRLEGQQFKVNRLTQDNLLTLINSSPNLAWSQEVRVLYHPPLLQVLLKSLVGQVFLSRLSQL